MRKSAVNPSTVWVPGWLSQTLCVFFKGRRMNIIPIMSAILTIFSLNSGAITFDKVSCITDKIAYIQGENVIIKITNNSIEDINIVERKYIDGGFAVIEIKQNDGTWKSIELYAAANIITFIKLKRGDSHVYIWKTKGYNRNDTLATIGIYRVVFGNGVVSNQFTINVSENINQ